MPAVIEGATSVTNMKMSLAYVSPDNAIRCMCRDSCCFHCCMPGVTDGASCHRPICYLTMLYTLCAAVITILLCHKYGVSQIWCVTNLVCHKCGASQDHDDEQAQSRAARSSSSTRHHHHHHHHHHHQSHVSHARVSTTGPSRNSPSVKTSDRAGQLVPDRHACAA